MPTIRMSVDEWIKVKANPRQRDTEKHAAKAKHLLTPSPDHAHVSAARLPNETLVKLDGHTRALLWKRGTVPALRIYQLTTILRDRNEMLEFKHSSAVLPGIVGRRPKLTREQLQEVHEVTGSGRTAKYGTVRKLAEKFGCCVKVITRARQQGYMVYAREDKMKSASCA